MITLKELEEQNEKKIRNNYIQQKQKEIDDEYDERYITEFKKCFIGKFNEYLIKNGNISFISFGIIPVPNKVFSIV